MLRKLRSLLIIEHCPVLPFWATSGQDALVARLRRLSGEGFRVRQGWFLRWLLFSTWPIRSAIQVTRLNLRHGEKARNLCGKRRLRLLAEAAFVAVRYFLPAKHYYVYELFHARDWSFGLNCLNESEAGNLFALLDKGANSPVIEDKRCFAEWCCEHDLPAPRTEACFGLARGDEPELPHPPSDLFVKPVRGNKGTNCECWLVSETGRYSSGTGRRLSSDELANHLAANSRFVPLLVQPYLKQHPEVADLSPGPLAAVRLITGRYLDGRTVVVAATFKMPKGKSITNNHGISSRVDLDSGELGSAFAYSPFRGEFESHPDTNDKIVGRRLPDWEAVKFIGLKAHRHLPNFVFIGWDIALTESGPVLLEGNLNWDTLSIQKAYQSSLKDLPFGDICSEWLAAEDVRV